MSAAKGISKHCQTIPWKQNKPREIATNFGPVTSKIAGRSPRSAETCVDGRTTRIEHFHFTLLSSLESVRPVDEVVCDSHPSPRAHAFHLQRHLVSEPIWWYDSRPIIDRTNKGKQTSCRKRVPIDAFRIANGTTFRVQKQHWHFKTFILS